MEAKIIYFSAAVDSCFLNFAIFFKILVLCQSYLINIYPVMVKIIIIISENGLAKQKEIKAFIRVLKFPKWHLTIEVAFHFNRYWY
jgi:hypothetical protein